jgi:hypothetical protein
VHVAIGFGGFEEADAAVVGVADEAGEAFLAQLALDAATVGAGAEGEAGGLDFGLAEGDPVGGFAVDEGGGEQGGLEEMTAGQEGHGMLLD